MDAEVRFAEILTALGGVGLTVLVLGGHAVRNLKRKQGAREWMQLLIESIM